MKLKRVLVVLVAIMLIVAAVSGCGNSASSSTAEKKTEEKEQSETEKKEAEKKEPEKKETEKKETEKKETEKKKHLFGATYWTMNNPYFIALEAGVRSAVEANGDELRSFDPQGDVTKQISQIEDMIAQGVELIFLNPADWQGIRPGLDAAKRAGIPIIVLDTPVYDSDMVASTVWSDNYKAGQLCAEDMMSRVKSANIVIFDLPTDKSAIDRYNGFVDKIKDNENYKILDVHDGKGSTEGTMPIMDDMIQRHGKDINVVYGINDPSALGAISSLEAGGMIKDVLVYSVDGSPDGKAMIKNGKLTATAAQFPEKMGTQAVEYAYKLLAGEEIPKEVLIDVEMVNADTLSKYEIDGWK